ncbi:MAG: signal peptidase I [Candidatus Woesebacteria bacterium]
MEQQFPENLPGQSEDPAQEAKILETAQKHDKKRAFFETLKNILSFAAFIATVAIAATLINQFIFQSYYVDGTSMTPTLQNNDRLIIEKVSKTSAAIQGKPYIPKRGDIVVLDTSILDQYGHNEQLIKRVIGLPGETVHIENGIVTVKNSENPQGLSVDSELNLKLEPTYTTSVIDIVVPQDCIYVLGDNRVMNGSFDSRSFGPVELNKIDGRLALRIFPFNKVDSF